MRAIKALEAKIITGQVIDHRKATVTDRLISWYTQAFLKAAYKNIKRSAKKGKYVRSISPTLDCLGFEYFILSITVYLAVVWFVDFPHIKMQVRNDLIGILEQQGYHTRISGIDEICIAWRFA